MPTAHLGIGYEEATLLWVLTRLPPLIAYSVKLNEDQAIWTRIGAWVSCAPAGPVPDRRSWLFSFAKLPHMRDLSQRLAPLRTRIRFGNSGKNPLHFSGRLFRVWER
jgi:hypothetical protein